MWYGLGATAVLFVHLAFIVFVLAGGLLALRWRWVAAIHVPAAIWGFYVEAGGAVCPLTSLENALRERAGLVPYQGDFIEQLLRGLIYPQGLTREMQLVLAAVVVIANVLVYGRLLLRRGRG